MQIESMFMGAIVHDNVTNDAGRVTAISHVNVIKDDHWEKIECIRIQYLNSKAQDEQEAKDYSPIPIDKGMLTAAGFKIKSADKYELWTGENEKYVVTFNKNEVKSIMQVRLRYRDRKRGHEWRVNYLTKKVKYIHELQRLIKTEPDNPITTLGYHRYV